MRRVSWFNNCDAQHILERRYRSISETRALISVVAFNDAQDAALLLRSKVIGGLVQGVMSACAAILAYLPTKPLGLQKGFWASITAIAVVQSELGATKSSARDQFAGAAIGGLTSAVIVLLA